MEQIKSRFVTKNVPVQDPLQGKEPDFPHQAHLPFNGSVTVRAGALIRRSPHRYEGMSPDERMGLLKNIQDR